MGQLTATNHLKPFFFKYIHQIVIDVDNVVAIIIWW